MLNWSCLDKKRFDLKTAKLVLEKDLDLDTLLKNFRKEGGQFIIAKCDASYNQLLIKLFEEGFFVTDTILTYSTQLETASQKYVNPPNIDIYIADKSISDELGEIASKAFRDYRSHYHNNPRLDEKKCNEVYVDWAKNLVLRDDMADVVFSCSYLGKVAGFASLKVKNGIGVAGLLCVDPEFENEGIARILHQKRFQWCKKKGIKNFQINTSINNHKYINLLINIGYTFHSATYILHLNNF